jgi:hypothetical protein
LSALVLGLGFALAVLPGSRPSRAAPAGSAAIPFSQWLDWGNVQQSLDLEMNRPDRHF